MSNKKSNKKVPEKETRTRTWTFVIYPESAPLDWRDKIDNLHIEWVERPLHDKDLNADGEAKKPHIHILLLFGGVKSYEQVKEITDSLNCPIPQRCHNARALVRYMAHLDNPEKHQYSVSDILGHGGVDIVDMLRPSSSERYTMIKDMVKFIKENSVIEFQDLIDYAIVFEPDTWFPLLCDNSAFVINMYIKSQRYRQNIHFSGDCVREKELQQDEMIVDAETGEVVG